MLDGAGYIGHVLEAAKNGMAYSISTGCMPPWRQPSRTIFRSACVFRIPDGLLYIQRHPDQFQIGLIVGLVAGVA